MGGRGLTFVLLVAAYFVAGKLGLQLAFVNASATAIWPPTGIAIAALLLIGLDLWPAILIGAFIVNLTTSGDLPSSIGIAIGNTLEAVIATRVVQRWAGGRAAFERPYDVLGFALLAAGLATMVSATIGVTSLALAGLASWSEFAPIWLTWWLGDASGALLITPAIVLWATSGGRLASDRTIEVALLGLTTLTTGVLVFGGLQRLAIENYPIAFLSFPVLVWAAFRFGPREAATVALAIGAIAVWGTLNGFGPYVLESSNESLLMLQSFMAVAVVTTLVLAAAVSERHRTDERLLLVEQRLRAVAEDAARVREEFLSVATHELRTPVTSVSGYAQLAQRSFLTGETDRVGPALQALVRQSARLAALITQLLDASYVQSGRLNIERRPSDLSALTAETVEAARLGDAERHRWDVQIDPAIRAEVDPLRWEQVVGNLLDNATKYSADGRMITIRLRRDGGGVSLAVHDDGIGIAPELVRNVFDRFYRVHEDQGLRGLGLGLYIAREIVVRHGGQIAVSSVEGQGSTFTVTLPLIRATATAYDAPPHAVAAAARSRRHRVLVVDDDADLRALIETVLRDAGHSVMTAKNGVEALALTARERPDLILLDKLMPVMDGTAFARAYRAGAPEPAPIIAFCAARDAKEWGASIGAAAHVAKPFEVDDLERTVQRLLDAHPGHVRASP